MPKPCRGSHKYSVSFTMIDPSIPSPSGSIALVWFCNSIDGLHMKYKVGDIIRIENTRVDEFNGFPQLVAKDSNCNVTIFHRRSDPITGSPVVPLTPTPDQLTSGSSSNRKPFKDAAWETTVLGNFDIEQGAMTKKQKADLHPPVDRPPQLWPEEIKKLNAMYYWAQRVFREHSSSAEKAAYFCSLHALQTFISTGVNADQYSKLEPTVENLNLSDSGVHRGNIVVNGKCDVVCLVTSIVYPTSSGDNLARMTIWDGTTNGAYQVVSLYRQPVQVALEAPSVYDNLLAAQATEEAESEQMQQLYQKAVQPRKLLGSAVRIQTLDPSLNAHITRLKPGMWVRIRNLYAILGGVTPGGNTFEPRILNNVCTVRGDSHICQLNPSSL